MMRITLSLFTSDNDSDCNDKEGVDNLQISNGQCDNRHACMDCEDQQLA